MPISVSSSMALASTAEDALALEQVGDRAGGAHLAAAALEDFADFAVGAVAVVGEDVDQDGDAAGAVAFVGELLEDCPSVSPVPRLMARSMLSLGMLTSRALSMA